MMNCLPVGFEGLEPFLARWGGRTISDRMRARSEASMEDIQQFYDAALHRAPEALDYLKQFPLHSLPDDAANLFCLMLALAQASMAVELHGQPRAPNSPYPHTIRVVKGAQPFG